MADGEDHPIVGGEVDPDDLFPRDNLSPDFLPLGHVPKPQSVVVTGGDHMAAIVRNECRDVVRRYAPGNSWTSLPVRDILEMDIPVVRIRRDDVLAVRQEPGVVEPDILFPVRNS